MRQSLAWLASWEFTKGRHQLLGTVQCSPDIVPVALLHSHTFDDPEHKNRCVCFGSTPSMGQMAKCLPAAVARQFKVLEPPRSFCQAGVHALRCAHAVWPYS
mmetsp:Transcript_69967/g.226301  ORF Transcript_69967/g.226301 Transcript_69967/m.226301 type:complete len:102 (-) Transcript_69967:460-765(-)